MSKLDQQIKSGEIRRCMGGNDNTDKGYHLWSALNGKSIRWPKTDSIPLPYGQQCPRHGGHLTAKNARANGIPEEVIARFGR